MRKAFLLLGLLIPFAVFAADLPRTFGKLKFGMAEAQVTAATGADFSSWCASCPPDGDEVSLDASHFTLFVKAFPGLSPTRHMPKDAVVLLTTKGKLSGIVIHPEENQQQIFGILQKQYGKPSTTYKNGTVQWRDSKTILEADFSTVRIYDRAAFPNF